MFSAISFRHDGLYLLDQRHLPHREEWLACKRMADVAIAIETMVVRGAPAIGCAAAYALALDARLSPATTWAAYAEAFQQAHTRLAATRPTAVNLFYALNRMRALGARFEPGLRPVDYCALLAQEAQAIFDEDLATCQAIGQQGLALLNERWPDSVAKRLRVLTHCNTGSLATAGYGTALGVIRALHQAHRLEMVYVDETRPWLQGARLTAYELQKEGIPHTLIVDSAAAHLMQRGAIDCAIVGADRITANGDTANKIGTYSVAVAAHYHDLPFYVAAPCTTIDLGLADGRAIPIELRPSHEVTHMGGQALAPAGVESYNPSFDVTPQALITGIITERGVARQPFAASLGGFGQRPAV